MYPGLHPRMSSKTFSTYSGETWQNVSSIDIISLTAASIHSLTNVNGFIENTGWGLLLEESCS